MRNYLLLTILLSFLHVAARGQTIASLDDIDLSDLPQTTKAKALRYWFDDDGGSVMTVSQLSGLQTLNASALIDGLHTLNYQVIDENDVVANVQTALFIKTNGEAVIIHAKQLRYWFDDDANSLKTVTATNGIQNLDASQLTDGLHAVHYQVIETDGSACHVVSGIFIKTGKNTTGLATPKELRYWFDQETDVKIANVGCGMQMIDASTLHEGLHTVQYQLADNEGQLSSPVSSMFMKANTSTIIAKKFRYWFDDDVASMKVTDVSNGIQVLDVSGLISGLHTLTYQIIDNDGKVGIPVSRMFLKEFDKVLADNKNNITKYQYWLNGNNETVTTVALDEAVPSYTLIDLIPMPQEPIHSNRFHFEIADGQPTIYTKNLFNIRFYDSAGYFFDDNRTFVDYRVKETVTDFEWLNSGVVTTTDKPEKDAIKWYKLMAEPGDSLQFKLDRAATIQLFAPSGKELLSASGAEAVNWVGCHVWEEGTYFVALHDVTATWGDNISLEYNHIDKYAVLQQDISVVGNGGCSTITFVGNGFRDLFAVELFTDQGESIQHVYIGHESDATTSVVFDFTDATLGQYHAKFSFTEEDKVFNNLVTVEEAKDIELATTVNYPDKFLRGTSTTYTIKITNNGNMTAYAVPVYTYIKSLTEGAITHIYYNGIDLPDIFSQTDLSELSPNELKELKKIEKELGASPYFISFKVALENEMEPALNTTDCDSAIVRTGLFFVDVAPNSTKELKLIIQSTELVEAWIKIPENWVLFGGHSNNTLRKTNRMKRVSAEGAFCCYRDYIECFLEVKSAVCDVTSFVLTLLAPETEGTAALVGLAVALEGCKTTINNNRLKGFGNALCNSDKEKIEERILEGLIASAKSAIDIPAILSCVGAALSGASALKLTSGAISNILKNVSLYLSVGSVGLDIRTLLGDSSCKTITSPKPYCPPGPRKGGPSTPVASMDPNEIYGYTAESGSKAVKDELTDVYYRIEFENDPEYATAAAHDIYVTDQLDGSMFDLSTFTPTRIKIGDKSAELTGEKNFVTTIDMRPEINAIAQVEGTYDQKKGIAQWHISSLDPMTMEPTKYVMDGVLPVNTNGQGIGELMYDIKLKDGLAHGTEVPNQASIVFDTNEPIRTPTWTNVIDRIAPSSHITKVEQAGESDIAKVNIEATDELSGPWRYDVYVQYGEGSAWWKAAENVPVGSEASVKVYGGIKHSFYVVATDMAGNVEQKEAISEFTLDIPSTVKRGDANADGSVSVTDIAVVVNVILQLTSEGGYSEYGADANGDGDITVTDIGVIVDKILGTNSSAGSRKMEPELEPQ